VKFFVPSVTAGLPEPGPRAIVLAAAEVLLIDDCEVELEPHAPTANAETSTPSPAPRSCFDLYLIVFCPRRRVLGARRYHLAARRDRTWWADNRTIGARVSAHENACAP
jgi:hypothetical protein